MDIDMLLKEYDYDYLYEEIRKKITYCWNDCITVNNIEEWLNNFSGKVYEQNIERKLALMLLNSFIYISHDEVLHLCRVIYYEFIHKIFSYGEDFNEVIKKTKFYPVGNPSESSSLVMYFFRIANELAKDRFDYYPQSASEDNRVVFVDDISGSGNQAGEYIEAYINKTQSDSKYIDYLCLISTEDAIGVFKKLNVNLISACVLDDRMKLFTNDSYTKFNREVSEILVNFVRGYEAEVQWDPLGYKSTQIAFGFYYNVPDNCIPIFWSEFANWQALFKRFHKKYTTNEKGEVFDDRDKYV